MKDKGRRSYQEYAEILDRANNPNKAYIEFVWALQRPFIEDIWNKILDGINIYQIPQDPILSRLIIEALLERLGGNNAREGGAVRGAILTMANIERLLISPEKKVEQYIEELDKIRRGRVSRLSHYPPTMQTQVKALIDYFRQEGFPRANNKKDRGQWINKHKQKIYELLIVFNCPCNYQAFEKWSKEVDKEVGMPDTVFYHYPDNARAFLLASLHNTTSENIKKFLKKRKF